MDSRNLKWKDERKDIAILDYKKKEEFTIEKLKTIYDNLINQEKLAKDKLKHFTSVKFYLTKMEKEPRFKDLIEGAKVLFNLKIPDMGNVDSGIKQIKADVILVTADMKRIKPFIDEVTSDSSHEISDPSKMSAS